MVIWIVAGAAIAGILIRPWNLPEAVWTVSAALILVLGGWVSWPHTLHALVGASDVCFFLLGMMLLSAVAQQEGLFGWLAAQAANLAKGSPKRLFFLVYLVGVGVTIFLSNDATVIVLAPAVLATAQAAGAEALPHLFICAFVANAASFVLPISNPANLVLYGTKLPPLLVWLRHFLVPSLAALVTTLALLFLIERQKVDGFIKEQITVPCLPDGAKIAAMGIALTALLLLAVSALDRPLGLTAALAGTATMGAVLLRTRTPAWPSLRAISWQILPMVAGLFVLVEALEQAGAANSLGRVLSYWSRQSIEGTAAAAALALACNVINNLPAGLIAGSIADGTALPPLIRNALLIGVDLGPNLSITGSLATILWLTVLRRAGIEVTFFQFLAKGATVTLPALLLALMVLLSEG